MKKILTTAAALLAIVVSLGAADPEPAGVPIDTKIAQTLKTYTPPEFDVKKDSLDGQVIRLKFTSRDSAIKDTKDNALLAGVAQSYGSYSGKAGGGSTSVDVTFPKEQRDWFAKISTAFSARASITAIGRVRKIGNGYRGHVIDLLGREIKTDMKGSRIVW